MPQFDVHYEAGVVRVYYAHTDRHSTIFGIPVTIQKEGDVFTVVDHEINMYGVGSTKEEAEEDYKSIVIEYFEDLEANENKIGENLKRDLDYLRMKLEH